ncbi:uncharacterized protein HMPREF1541_04990 [Cyphellophora europaea CBS 101466]|uniref:DASH complex subunit DAD1 n=1 Tax=Cyphellophora europaea (strain CBS 101466) TaxID=1220924 RepID=W2RW09_CYPE1|nr:uncharacterized protein HMPREF1541_04990 [Cyphellophora europaea CBS 101466]ETN40711.1 hypothetical protein HMPREF1541_04990 [Cyphellophora europaea CBS 101466]
MSTSIADAPQPAQSEFQQRRAALVTEIGDSLEQVLTQINALNRGLEGIIEIGNEFASVEALWSQFEGVMGNQGGGGHEAQGEGEGVNGKDGQEAKEGEEEEGDTTMQAANS